MPPIGVVLVNTVRDDRSNGARRRTTALECVANRPIICHALEALTAASVEEVAVAVPAAVADEVQSCIEAERPRDIEVSYVTYDDARGASKAMRSTAERVGDAPCIVHFADGLLAQPLAPFAAPLNDDSADLLLLLHYDVSPADRLPDATRRLLRIAEFEPTQSSLGMAGVCLFGPGALLRACDGAHVDLAAGEIDLVTVAGGIARAGGRMEVQLVRGWHRYVGQVEDLLELNRATLDALTPEPPHPGCISANKISGRVAIDPTAYVRSSVILGPVIIGPRARVADAYIGPYTSIGPDARVDGAEIERSIISSGASIMHVGQRLAGSVVGPGARIFRDFSLPRAIRLCVGDNSEVALP